MKATMYVCLCDVLLIKELHYRGLMYMVVVEAANNVTLRLAN